MPSQSVNFVPVAKAESLAPGSAMKVEAEGLSFALYNLDGTFYATAEICSHAHASLAEGFILDDTIECPLHGACFSIKTGEALSAPATDPVLTFPVRVDDGDVLIGIPSATKG
jgi:3-phenylpropionate/trans-cinnamate dioxygenase ferredoxin component